MLEKCSGGGWPAYDTMGSLACMGNDEYTDVSGGSLAAQSQSLLFGQGMAGEDI